MRGLYTATLLETLANRVARVRGVESLDMGKGFDLITGTSTGGILACGLAKGIPIDRLIGLYRKTGSKIFPDPMPGGPIALKIWAWNNRRRASSNAAELIWQRIKAGSSRLHTPRPREETKDIESSMSVLLQVLLRCSCRSQASQIQMIGPICEPCGRRVMGK